MVRWCSSRACMQRDVVRARHDNAIRLDPTVTDPSFINIDEPPGALQGMPFSRGSHRASVIGFRCVYPAVCRALPTTYQMSTEAGLAILRAARSPASRLYPYTLSRDTTENSTSHPI
jgi:hypothetical protein